MRVEASEPLIAPEDIRTIKGNEIVITKKKTAAEVLDYVVDDSLFLGSDTIASVTWLVSPAGVTIGSTSNTSSTATIWLSGGTVGVTYVVTCRITTAGGRTKDYSFNLRIVNDGQN